MNRFTTTVFAAAVACFAIGANAQMKVNAADLPHITNGGTGFIGVTDSAMKTDRMAALSMAPAATPMAATTTMKSSTRTDWTPAMSQEATPTYDAAKTLGSGPMSDPRMHRSWGTPD
jgi:hypothetical protein